MSNYAFGVGSRILTENFQVLDVWYPNPELGTPQDSDWLSEIISDSIVREKESGKPIDINQTIELDLSALNNITQFPPRYIRDYEKLSNSNYLHGFATKMPIDTKDNKQSKNDSNNSNNSNNSQKEAKTKKENPSLNNLKTYQKRIRQVMLKVIDLDANPSSAEDVFLRLHLLSHLCVKPNTINLEGIFNILPTIAQTNFGPMLPDEIELARFDGLPITVTSIDKIPYLTNYVIPDGVRIADSSRVRLGAYLSPGTTVMPAGYVNFNAGTLGSCMVEGRISQGVVIGQGTDIGGGASIMGTLSGGGKQKVSLGSSCLLGANAGLGISLGNGCTVEAGLYITAGTKVKLVNFADDHKIWTKDFKEYKNASGVEEFSTKAVNLNKMNDILFRRNSLTGIVEAVYKGTTTIKLNKALH